MSASRPSFASASRPAPDLNAPRLGAGSASGFAALGAGALATAITTPVILHALGQAGFGLWVTLLAAVSFTGLLDFGFAQAAGRFVGEHRARGDEGAVRDFIATIASAYAAAFVLVMVATLGIGLALPSITRPPAAWGGAILPASLLIGLATAIGLWMGFSTTILHAHQRLPLANATRVLYWVLAAVLMIGAALFGTGLLGLAGAMAISALAVCLLQVRAVSAVVPGLWRGRPRLAYLRQALTYSVFMFLISVGATIVFETDTLVIAGFRGVAAVAAYAIALRLTRGLTLVLHKLPEVLFPFYAGMHAVGDLARIRQNFLLTARLEMAGAAAVILGLVFAGGPLLALWVGAANVAGTVVFLWALALIGMEAAIHPAAVLAAATGGERRMALFNNAEAALNLGLSIVFVIRFGVAGVIAATVLAQALTNLWYLPRWAVRQVGVSPRAYLMNTIGRVALPALVGGGAGSLIAFTLPSTAGAILAAAIAVGLFAAVYLLTARGSEERRFLASVVGGRAA